ncbi:MAG TPA: N-acetylmuramidase family protein [Limnobacter sp.]|nr:N-acetylmuramidase family protein [Limnobacter sp.]
MISKSVGRGGANQLSDVVWVQERLNKCNAQIVLPVDGVYSPKTAAAIDYFQGRFLGMTPTGLVAPNEGTAIKLSQTPNGCWAPKDMLRLPPGGSGRAMQPTDFERAAGILNIELPVVKAVAAVESNGQGFDTQGRPVILFEPHLFSRFTQQKYDEAFPWISSKKWNRSLYGKGGTPYEKLEVASALDRSAALQSCSWGAFQILGLNYKLCGFDGVDEMVAAMFQNEGEHLLAFVRYVKSRKLDRLLRIRDWSAFANSYNGPNYRQNQYDEKLEQAYQRFSR